MTTPLNKSIDTSQENLKALLIQSLTAASNITHVPWPEREDGFSTLELEGVEIAHFHNFEEIDIRFGRAFIHEQKLARPLVSSVHPTRSKNSAYLEMPFHRKKEVANIVELMLMRFIGRSSQD